MQTQSYAIKSTNGNYLRASMRDATRESLVETLLHAAAYIGCETPTILDIDGGEVYVYGSQTDADNDTRCILTATPRV
jgi:hypothetical protein